MWEFTKDVADRFQTEARHHIPDYDRVIDLCVDIVHKADIPKQSNIIDVGSATGRTIEAFNRAGFTNTYGVESSEAMIANSLHKDKVIHSSVFPDIECRAVLANWTLHFVHEREEYIRKIYKQLTDGVFILSDKTTQSDIIKNLYYDWKINNGVDPTYILQKEIDLRGVLVTYPPEWYWEVMHKVGFKNVQVINSRFGFTTFYGEK